MRITVLLIITCVFLSACAYYLVPEPHCVNEIFDMGEEGLDCGGSCNNICRFDEKCGDLSQDEVWRGNIHVSCWVHVPEGKSLIIEPGTIVKFKHDRNYKSFDRAGLSTNGGQIIAEGTPENLVWFTSDAETPINGDWGSISIVNSHDSRFDFVVVEYGEMGIEQFDSSVPITNSIIRWSNAEGLYAERSTPLIQGNLLYGNGYHEIALEQYNTNVEISGNIFRDGTCGVHNEKTQSNIEGNSFENMRWPAITAGMESDVRIVGNRFRDIPHNPPYSISGGSVSEIHDNDYGDGSVPVPNLLITDVVNTALGYIPGDPEDMYPYVYSDYDETRRTIKKIGEGLGFGWALVYANDYLYRFSLGSGTIGDSLDFIRVNPDTGVVERFGNDVIMNPRGLTFDGEYFYVNDFSVLKVFKFKLEGTYITIYDSFDIPDKELGGTSGLTTDGEYLYLRSRDASKLYKMTKEGVVVGEIVSSTGGFGPPVWNGEYFWSAGQCGKGICKFSPDGQLLGDIYLPAKDTWAVAWEPADNLHGGYLWTIQRTCELWDDPKIYKIEILDDTT